MKKVMGIKLGMRTVEVLKTKEGYTVSAPDSWNEYKTMTVKEAYKAFNKEKQSLINEYTNSKIYGYEI